MTQETGKNNQTSLPSPEELEKMSFDDLVLLRDKLKGTKDDETVAPYEHKAFVKQYLGDADDLSIAPKALGLLAAIPGYQLKKLVSRKEGETPASAEQMVKSLEGVGEALSERIVEPWKRVWNKRAEEQAATPAPEPAKTTPAPWERQWATQGTKPGEKAPKARFNYSALDRKERTKAEQADVDKIMEMKPTSRKSADKFNQDNAALIREELKRSDLSPELRSQYKKALGE